LVQSYESWPINVHPLNAAAMQLELASAAAPPLESVNLLKHAAEIINRAITDHDQNHSIAIEIGICTQLARATGDADDWNHAIELARLLTKRDPNSISAWRQLGDVLWAANQRGRAAAAYQQALEHDADFALDEYKRLSETDSTRLRDRIAAAQSNFPPN
jgi:tetratricopeptide (TPR) repeat protein